MPGMQLYFSVLLVSIRFVYPVTAQVQNVQFNQVVNLNGDMQLNSLIFPDNSKIETFSQTQRQVLVNQNPSPLTANHVIGSSGQPFVQLSQNSMTIATNGATDLVGAQIEFNIQQATLDQNGVTPDNTFVAMLAPDRQAWMIMETMKSVNTTDQTVRMVKMTSIDGEYMAIGRKTIETGTVLSPFGRQQSVNISGSGIQEVEYQDGLRMAIRATQPMTVSADVVNGVSSSMTNGLMPVNNYRYLVRTNLAGVSTNLNQVMTVMQLPLNAMRAMQMATTMGAGPNSTVMIGIAQRNVLQNPGGVGGSLQPQKRQKKASSSSKAAAKATSTASSSSSSDASSTSDSAAAAATDASATDGTATDASAVSSVSDVSAAAATDASASSASSSSSSASSSSSSGGGASATQASNASNNQPPSNTNNNNPAATQLLLSPTFTPVTAKTVFDTSSGRIAATVSQVDGEFILTMAMPGAAGAAGQEGKAGASASGVLVSMEELRAMVALQKTGGMLPLSSMMSEFMASQGQTSTSPEGATIKRSIREAGIARRSVGKMERVRRVVF